MSTEEDYYNEQISKMGMDNHQLQTHLAGLGGEQQIEPGIIKEQLSLGDELETIDNLLNSRVLVYDEKEKKQIWKTPTDEDQIVLSDYGVHHFRQIISGYINKNKLLSNYDEDRILTKMKDIATVINDDFLKFYEKIFYVPTVEYCVNKIRAELKEDLEISKHAHLLAGIKFNEEIKQTELLEKVQSTLEKRIKEIRQQSMTEKIKKMDFILRFIQDTIEDTYNRALGGQERRSLRQNMTVTEARGGFNMPQQQPKKQSTFGWLKPKK